MISLHINGWTPPALAVAIALREKGVEFAVVEHDWQASAEALEPFAGQLEPLNSLEGEMPLLVADGVALCDSYFILEYLDDRHPAPALRPADAYGQWQVQALARFFGERALPAISSLGVAKRFGGQEWPAETVARFSGAKTITSERRDAWNAAFTDADNESIKAESDRKVALLFERLDKTLAESGGPWLLGEQFTLADIEAFVLTDPFLSGPLGFDGIDVSAAVRTWHDQVGQRPAVKATLANSEPAFVPGPEHSRWG